MAGAPDIAIDLSRRRLRAVNADFSRGRLRIRRTMSEPWPEDLDFDDVAAVGAWLGRRLHQAGMPRDRAVIALPRESVALKRLTLPTTDDVELPDMTRLAMQRELPFDPATAVIDFMTLRRTDAATHVLAVAAPREVIERADRLARAAGVNPDRISLRCLGAAALIDAWYPAAEQRDRRVLLIDAAGDGGAVELNVIEDGSIRFSRAAEIAPGVDPAGHADAIIREVRRSWMSYRIVDDDSRVDAAVLLAEKGIPRSSVESLSEMLGVRAELLERHPSVEADDRSMDGLWPLAGLLLAPNLGAGGIDFLHPRQAPDVGARTRQLALAAAGVLVIGGFGAWTWAHRALGPLKERLAGLQSESSSLAPQYQRYGRDLYKLEHLRQWEGTCVDWLGHALALHELSPGPGAVVLDEWTGAATTRGIEFDARGNAWSAPLAISIVLDGEAVDRRTADEFRAALVSANRYAASSSGADVEGGRRLPVGFTFRLETSDIAPPESRPADDSAGEGDGRQDTSADSAAQPVAASSSDEPNAAAAQRAGDSAAPQERPG